MQHRNQAKTPQGQIFGILSGRKNATNRNSYFNCSTRGRGMISFWIPPHLEWRWKPSSSPISLKCRQCQIPYFSVSGTVVCELGIWLHTQGKAPDCGQPHQVTCLGCRGVSWRTKASQIAYTTRHRNVGTTEQGETPAVLTPDTTEKYRKDEKLENNF